MRNRLHPRLPSCDSPRRRTLAPAPTPCPALAQTPPNTRCRDNSRCVGPPLSCNPRLPSARESRNHRPLRPAGSHGPPRCVRLPIPIPAPLSPSLLHPPPTTPPEHHDTSPTGRRNAATESPPPASPERTTAATSVPSRVPAHASPPARQIQVLPSPHPQVARRP
ncbi:proline-rich receptor-like protein kinase PERK2 [Miscanthus floridulus]|uniref:proline-rich receptor-like protein kinase PERK2 n=1 Tax=Miscanthus floridulus TaxID=154761 RepID=UPI003458C260